MEKAMQTLKNDGEKSPFLCQMQLLLLLLLLLLLFLKMDRCKGTFKLSLPALKKKDSFHFLVNSQYVLQSHFSFENVNNYTSVNSLSLWIRSLEMSFLPGESLLCCPKLGASLCVSYKLVTSVVFSRYLNRVARHPILREDPDFRQFLETDVV